MIGAMVCQVERSNLADFAAGDFVLGYGGWQTKENIRPSWKFVSEVRD
jgi:NADPH-dependent curcumin reductase CurA